MSTVPFFSFGVQSLYAGGGSPYSPAFESLVTANLEGVQSATVALSYPREDLFSWDGGGDQELIDRPRAELNFSYLFTSGLNEKLLGFVVSPNSAASAFSNLNAERNFYMLFNQEAQDLIGYSGWNNKVMAFGNGVLTHYDFSAQVGQPTTVNATISALNLLIQPSGTGQPLPSVFKQSGTYPTGLYTLPFAQKAITDYSEAVPRNIVLTIDSGCAIGALLSGNTACPVQSFNFSFSIPRQEMKDIGWAYPNTRSATWPIEVDISANAYLNALQVDTLNRFGCPDSGFNFGINFDNACNTDTDAFTFRFNGAKLNSQSFVSRIGNLTQMSFNWSLKVYDIARLSGPNLFMTSSGVAYSSIVFPEVSYVSGSSPLVINLGTLCYLVILSGPGILIGNQVEVTDEASTVVVRAVTTDGSDTEDITLTVG